MVVFAYPYNHLCESSSMKGTPGDPENLGWRNATSGGWVGGRSGHGEVRDFGNSNHNGRDGASTHQPRDCLLNHLFRRRSKKSFKLRVTGLCAGNSPVTGEFPAQMSSNAENIFIWWRHHVCSFTALLFRRHKTFPHHWLSYQVCSSHAD